MFSTRLVVAITISPIASMCGSPEVAADDRPKAATEKREPAPGTPEYIERALRKKVSLAVDSEPLRDVLKDLSKQVDAPILVETSALDALGLSADETNVTIALKGLSLRSVLRVVLADLELTYMNYEGVVLVTTPESAEQNLVTKIYEVVDLISRDEDTSPTEYDYDSLIDVIVTTVAPVTWDEVGGACSATGYRGTIVVSATTEVHEHVTTLLAGMRKAKEIAAKHRDTTPPVASIPLSWNGELPEEEKAIFRALDSLVSLEFDETPLKEVAAQISKQHRINVLFKESALDAVGLGPGTPVTFSVKNIKLRSALRLMLSDIELTYHISDGVLWISTPEDAEENLITRAYPVFDVVDAASPSSEFTGEAPFSNYDYHSLTELMMTTLVPTTWDEVGGPASIAVMHPFGFLVISQTQFGHEELENFLVLLRKTAPAKARVTKPDGRERTRMVVYIMPGTKSKLAKAAEGPAKSGQSHYEPFGGWEALSEVQLLELIRSTIAPESWASREDVYAKAMAGRVIIRHTNSVHRQIHELAKRLYVPDFREFRPWPGGPIYFVP